MEMTPVRIVKQDLGSEKQNDKNKTRVSRIYYSVCLLGGIVGAEDDSGGGWHCLEVDCGLRALGLKNEIRRHAREALIDELRRED